MSQVSYGQYCPLAYALDLLGERWTLLIIRELIHGPRSYKEILQNLPDMGAIKLTRRLGMLEKKNVIARSIAEKRSADEPYILTERGKKLEVMLRDLAAWGMEEMELPTKFEVYSPLWSLLELQIRFKPELADNLNMMFELRIENETHHVEISHRTIKTRVGPAPSPLFTISTDSATFILILRGMLSLRQAIQMERVDIDGSLAALTRTLNILGLRAQIQEEAKQSQLKEDGGKDDNNMPNIELYPAR